MAWAERRSNGNWRGAWRTREGRTRYTSAIYLTRKAAEAVAWEAERDARSTPDAYDPNLTWGGWAERWLPLREQQVSHGTRANDRVHLKRLHAEWDRTKLTAISGLSVQDWVARMQRERVGPGSLRKIVTLFSASLSAAVEARLLSANPCHGVKLPRPPEGAEQFFTPEEIDAIMAWLNEPYRSAVGLMAETGLRFGELAGLHWQHVDRLHAQLQVVVSWSRDGTVMTPTKGRKRRWVPLSTRALALLDAIPRSALTECGQIHEGTVACRSGLVLPSPHGLPLNGRNMRERHWLPALRGVGLSPARQHDLRHTFASWMAQAGIPLSDIAEALGHSDAYVTRRYAHLAGSHLGRIRTALDGLRAPLAEVRELPRSEVAP